MDILFELESLMNKGELSIPEQQQFEGIVESIKFRISELETEKTLLSGVHEEMLSDIDRELEELRRALDGNSLVR